MQPTILDQRAIVRLYERASSLEEIIDECVARAAADVGEPSESAQIAQDAPIIRLVELLLLEEWDLVVVH